MYCVICGKEIEKIANKFVRIYYDTLQCPDCFYVHNVPQDCCSDTIIPLNKDIVLVNFNRRVVMSTKYYINGSIYHPITGEYIKDFKQWAEKLDV